MKGIYLALLSAIIIGLATPFIAESAKHADPLVLVVLSNILIFLVLLPMLKFNFKNLQLKEFLKSRDFWTFVLLRIVLANTLVLIGFSMTSAIKGGFILKLEPIFVALIGLLFFKEKIEMKNWILIALIIFGAFLLSTGGNLEEFTSAQLGDGILILTSLFFAASFRPAGNLSKIFGSVKSTAVVNLFGGLIMIVPALIWILSNGLNASLYGIILIVIFAVLFAVGLVLWFKSLETVEPWAVGSVLILTSIVSSVVAYFWLGETLNAVQIVGAVMIVLISFLIIYLRR